MAIRDNNRDYYEGSLHEKMESYTKPTITSIIFKEPPIISLQKRKIIKGHAR